MKKILLFIAILSTLTNLSVNAQSVVTVTGDISSNTSWTNNNIYLLNGFVYVTNNSILNIQEGTIIKGDKASKGSLIVTRGAKLIADGSPSSPIVFTSNEPAGARTYGDWGGIILCGRAPINDPAGEKVIEGGVDAVKGLYGGNDAADYSGILRYVRIEFPGIAFMPNNEINGLTLGGVGSATIIDYVQVSYSGDDSFECFGGTVNLKHLIAYRGVDDDFDTDYGFSGKCQFLVAMRDSNVADVSGSNGFESDNDATGSTNNPFTYPVYSNVTLIGPMINSSTVINANFKRGAHIRRSAKTSIFNSAIAGFPTGLLVDGANSEASATNNELMVQANVLAGCSTPLSVASGSTWDISAWFNNSISGNSSLPNSADIMLTDPNNYISPDFRPLSGSLLLGGANFASNLINDPFFETVSYRGAFGAADWTSGWANYDCQNSNYILGINEVSNINGFNIYPNPASEYSRIVFNLRSASSIRICIYDMKGEIVGSKVMGSMSAGSHSVLIPFGNLSKGLFTIRIISDTGSVVNNVSIQ